ncbi:MAG TPA: hypothetical protein VN648_22690, partial [Candidatus Methylomirabilis sp.]|nr:hypothetical protein [Candidatus Methylomirabilis sp.]
MMLNRITQKLRREWAHRQNDRRMHSLAEEVAHHQPPTSLTSKGELKPVVFFNASTRLTGLSLNAAYSLLSAWSLRLQGIPVIHAVCRSAMAPCVLGTNRAQPSAPPPCSSCMAQSAVLFGGAQAAGLDPVVIHNLHEDLAELSLAELQSFRFDGLPFGELVTPSARWILRRGVLLDDEPTRLLLRQYIFSAVRIARQFRALLQKHTPRALVLFNGMFFPEAAARQAALEAGIPVITHEVGLLPYSSFFTTGEATAYPLDVPESFELTPEQNARLDAYLEERFSGNFSMAGIKFWPEMHSLGEEFWRKADGFKQVVPVFTNVVFDTSQGHANVIFPSMFSWLDCILEMIRAHPETFFVIRAHPDESRPGKESRESVSDWVRERQVGSFPNVLFVGPEERFSSYELIQRSKFVMIYNSTIGLEASILGMPVLSGG